MAEVSVPQVKAARALLGWTQAELAIAASVSLPTIKRFETGTSPIPVVRAAIIQALEHAGVVFVNDVKYCGVKLTLRTRSAHR
ncbi:helix-turn-helix domain-containing protein [Bradyrhizobium sp. USDA 372]